MGFPNQGAAKIKENLLKLKNSDICIGANIGKNKDTPNEQATDDYLICFDKLFDYCQTYTGGSVQVHATRDSVYDFADRMDTLAYFCVLVALTCFCVAGVLLFSSTFK